MQDRHGGKVGGEGEGGALCAIHTPTRGMQATSAIQLGCLIGGRLSSRGGGDGVWFIVLS